MQSDSHVGSFFRPGRLEALSDGVFAIVMTPLVLGFAILVAFFIVSPGFDRLLGRMTTGPTEPS